MEETMNIKKQEESLAQIRTRLQKEQRDLKKKKFLRNKMAVLGTIVVIILLIIAIFADVIAPYDPYQQSVRERLQAPSAAHIFGTDGYGRDLFSRVLYGGRISVLVGCSCAIISMVGGMMIGLCAAYFKKLDNLLMRICDGFNAIPTTLLAIALMAMLGPTVINVIIALGIVMIPRMARITRAQAVVIKEQTYIEAMRATGGSNLRILLKHIAPNCISQVVVQVSYNFANSIITESGLSFLGVGIPVPTPSWGNILNEGRDAILTQGAWWMILFPGLFLAVGVLGLNMFGDGIRDMLDPKTN